MVQTHKFQLVIFIQTLGNKHVMAAHCLNAKYVFVKLQSLMTHQNKYTLLRNFSPSGNHFIVENKAVSEARFRPIT